MKEMNSNCKQTLIHFPQVSLYPQETENLWFTEGVEWAVVWNRLMKSFPINSVSIE